MHTISEQKAKPHPLSQQKAKLYPIPNEKTKPHPVSNEKAKPHPISEQNLGKTIPSFDPPWYNLDLTLISENRALKHFSYQLSMVHICDTHW